MTIGRQVLSGSRSSDRAYAVTLSGPSNFPKLSDPAMQSGIKRTTSKGTIKVNHHLPEDDIALHLRYQHQQSFQCPIVPTQVGSMEYLTLLGESCYTQAETERPKEAIKRHCRPVLNVQGCWAHYVHLGHCDSVKVSVK